MWLCQSVTGQSLLGSATFLQLHIKFRLQVEPTEQGNAEAEGMPHEPKAYAIEGRRTMSIASKICVKVCEVHAIDKKTTWLFEGAKKPRSANPVFLEREALNHNGEGKGLCLFICTSIHMDVYVCTCRNLIYM